ncbi:methylmalonyl-CoA mutase [bacterium]|nr:MAG: methylmalonyl-CoA mutase [bacterium]
MHKKPGLSEDELFKKARKKEFKTYSGIPIKRVYRQDDIKNLDYDRDLADPGEFPFTRGLYPNMYRSVLWHMRLGTGYGLPEEANKRFKYLYQQGGQAGYIPGYAATTQLYDAPTNFGLDSDDPLARGEVGKVGVAIDTMEDMEILMDGFPLDKTFNNMVLYDSGVAAVLLAMYTAVAEKQKTSLHLLTGSCLNEPFQTFVCQKCSIFPLLPSLRLCLDVVQFTLRNIPKWNPISVYGNAIRESGGNAVQEVALALANAMAYTEAILARGFDIDDFAPRMTFYHNVNNELFEEVAKLRAARRMYARIMKERFKAKKPESMFWRTFCKTSGVALTAQQPYNNIIRSTMHALAAVLGGAQGVFVASFDEALSIPTEKAATIASRVNHILAEESGVIDTVDPLAGSYYVESLTNEIEKRVLQYLDEIEKMGSGMQYGSPMLTGVIKGIQTGFFENDIFQSNFKKMKDIESGKRIIVGVNKYQIEEDIPVEVMKVNLSVQKKKIERLKAFKKRRDQKRVDAALKEVKKVVSSDDNVMPTLIEAVKKDATLGEIIGVMKTVLGESLH